MNMGDPATTLTPAPYSLLRRPSKSPTLSEGLTVTWAWLWIVSMPIITTPSRWLSLIDAAISSSSARLRSTCCQRTEMRG